VTIPGAGGRQNTSWPLAPVPFSGPSLIGSRSAGRRLCPRQQQRFAFSDSPPVLDEELTKRGDRYTVKLVNLLTRTNAKDENGQTIAADSDRREIGIRRGFRTTSLADIAEAAKVPVGNVYYYFKTKDEIGEAIVEQRLLELRTLPGTVDQRGSPKERLLACIENTFENRDLLARGGCPIGLCARNCTRRAGLWPLRRRRSSRSCWGG